MTQDEYDKLISKIDAEFERVTQSQGQKRDEDKIAVARVFEIMNGHPPELNDLADDVEGNIDNEELGHAGKNGHQSPLTEDGRIRRGALQLAIENVLSAFRADFSFTVRDVHSALENEECEVAARSSNTSVTQVLRKLEQRGTIEILEQGSGRRPTSYRNVID